MAVLFEKLECKRYIMIESTADLSIWGNIENEFDMYLYNIIENGNYV